LTGTPFLARIMAGGLRRPKSQVLGTDLAGRVVAVGGNVRQFQPGDEVFGSCTRSGAFAEYMRAAKGELQLIPAHVTFEVAAAAGAAAFTALQGLRDAGKIRPGQEVLINGASGGVGSFAVQIARTCGARVTGVCSTPNLDLVRSLGVDQVIDYTEEDFTERDQRYDLVFDVAAVRSFSDCKRVLTPMGTYVTTAFSPRLVLAGLWAALTGSQRLVPYLAKPPDRADRVYVRELLEAGRLCPIIDRRYPLRELPEALGYLAEGHARGKVVITT